MYKTEDYVERSVLIAIDDERFSEDCLDELADLAKTAGSLVVGRLVQRRENRHPAHYFGKGKLDELSALIAETGANAVICDDELSSSQLKNLNDMLNVKVMDRTLLILDIFAKHAITAEGKVQVELAQLKYRLSHLSGLGTQLSRLGGGIGTRGPGEKKLEIDRRHIRSRIDELTRQLKEIETTRKVLRERREKNNTPLFSLVGYTNSGKSTLLNLLTDANVLAEDKLFATLDTVTRKKQLEGGQAFLLTDTVGFIRKLPTGLIKAFRATLEELRYADFYIHVVDASSSSREAHMKAVYETMRELDILNKPVLTVFNKVDMEYIQPLPTDSVADSTVSMSAKTGLGLDKLTENISNMINSLKKPMRVHIPYEHNAWVSRIRTGCTIVDEKFTESGTYMEIFADDEFQNRLAPFVTEEEY